MLTLTHSTHSVYSNLLGSQRAGFDDLTHIIFSRDALMGCLLLQPTLDFWCYLNR
jgi:hypothetical protein